MRRCVACFFLSCEQQRACNLLNAQRILSVSSLHVARKSHDDYMWTVSVQRVYHVKLWVDGQSLVMTDASVFNACDTREKFDKRPIFQF